MCGRSFTKSSVYSIQVSASRVISTAHTSELTPAHNEFPVFHQAETYEVNKNISPGMTLPVITDNSIRMMHWGYPSDLSHLSHFSHLSHL